MIQSFKIFGNILLSRWKCSFLSLSVISFSWTLNTKCMKAKMTKRSDAKIYGSSHVSESFSKGYFPNYVVFKSFLEFCSMKWKNPQPWTLSKNLNIERMSILTRTWRGSKKKRLSVCCEYKWCSDDGSNCLLCIFALCFMIWSITGFLCLQPRILFKFT